MKADANLFASVGFEYIGTPYSVMDCQAFVEKCLADCGVKKDLPGSNAWYREVMNNGWVGTPEECTKKFGKVPAGAMLFILLQDGKEPPKYRGDGIGNASHIGICTGALGQGAIHSSASRGCVAESKFAGKTIPNGGWNRVGLWDQIDYGESPEPDPPQPVPPEPGETAIVGNVPPDKRQDVNLRKRPSTYSVLVDRVPCGEIVNVLDRDDGWCKVKWNKETGYMMTDYLIFDDPPEPGSVYYCITIFDLTKEEADAIAAQYPNSEIMDEKG